MKRCSSAKCSIVIASAALAAGLLSTLLSVWMLTRSSNLTPSAALIDCAPLILFGISGLCVFIGSRATARARVHALEGQLAEAVRNAAAHERSRKATEVAANQFRAMLEQLPAPVIAADRSGRVAIMNVAVQKLMQLAPVTQLDALPSALGALFEATAGCEDGVRRSRDMNLALSEGMLSVRADCIAMGDLAIGVLMDLAAEQDAERRMGDFVAKASHELRTPLASIRAYAELLEDASAIPESERRQLLATMLTESDRLSRMVDQMLSISRIESGIARIQSAKVDLCALAAESVLAMRGEAQSKEIALVVSPCAVVATADGDRDMLMQVLLNLLSNGIKYTPFGGTVTISVDTDHLARSVVVQVTDTGPGIPPEAMGRLFEKFYRIESYRRLAKGTGLGLNLCRSVIEQMHGGQIGVDSTLTMGSRFWFSVPMERVGRIAA